MKTTYLAGAALALTACATTPVPAKRPMPPQMAERMTDVPVVVVANHDGIQKSWFMKDSSASTAQFGLVGALTSGIMDGIMNAAPAGRAQRAADEVAEVMVADALDEALAGRLTEMAAAGDALGTVTTLSKIARPGVIEDALELNVSYVLSEDASAMRVTAVASYEDSDTPYATPYYADAKPPKSELKGPFYRNAFVYDADPFAVPAMSPALKADLVRSAEELFRLEDGTLPTEGDDGYKKMAKAVEKARDEKLTKSETAYFLVREWTKDDAAALREQVGAAHDFIARMLVADLRDTSVPTIEGTDEIVSEMPDGRVVRKLGSGVAAGSYRSSPGGLQGTSTYGNAVKTAKVNRDAAKAAKQRGKDAGTR